MFKYQLELEDGTAAGEYTTAVPNWRPGDTIPLGPGKSYRVVDVKPHPTLSGVLVVMPANAWPVGRRAEHNMLAPPRGLM